MKQEGAVVVVQAANLGGRVLDIGKKQNWRTFSFLIALANMVLVTMCRFWSSQPPNLKYDGDCLLELSPSALDIYQSDLGG
jgi:hypothetical protein